MQKQTTCPSCGNRLEENARFCPRCGKAVANTISQTVPNSGQELIPNVPLTFAPGEYPIWIHESKQGIIHRKVTMVHAITNISCLEFDAISNKLVEVPISDCDVVVMNSRRVSNSVGGGTFVTRGGVGVYGGPRQSVSKTVGDLVFMKDGKPMMVFRGVSDPAGLKSLINTMKKELRER